jgi:hypothetical protein
MSQSWVYFVQVEHDGPIKIGTTNRLDERIKSLQTASPYKLRLLAKYEGSHAQERRLHVLYAEYRIRGEWFRPNQSLMELIDYIRAQDGADTPEQETHRRREAVQWKFAGRDWSEDGFLDALN